MNYVQETLYGLFFFLSFCDLFHVSFLCPFERKPSPVDLDVPVTFFLSHISGEERHGRLIIEQDSSRRRREEREAVWVSTCQTGGWGVGWVPCSGHHVLQTWRACIYIFGDMWEIKSSLSSSNMHEIKARVITAVIKHVSPESEEPQTAVCLRNDRRYRILTF